MAAIAREQGVTIDRIRQIKEKGLWRLRIGKAKRELLEKFDIAEAGAYRNSMNKFNEHGFMGLLLRWSISLYAGQNYRQSMKSIKKQVEIMFE